MPSERTEAFYWGLLGVVVTVACIVLTRFVTHVDRGAEHVIGVAFAHDVPRSGSPVTLGNLEERRFEVPVIAPMGYDELLFIVTPAISSVSVLGTEPFEMSCAYTNEVKSATALPTFMTLVRKGSMTSFGEHLQATPQRIVVAAGMRGVLALIARRVWGTVLRLPPSLRTALRQTPLGEAAIRCSLARPITASPTFSERTVLIASPDPTGGLVALDMSGFDGIDDIRFGGGLSYPSGGAQLRVFDTKDRLVRVQWADEAALEQRDIILVLIGGLAAVAAAMFIESMRPAVKSRAASGDARNQ